MNSCLAELLRAIRPLDDRATPTARVEWHPPPRCPPASAIPVLAINASTANTVISLLIIVVVPPEVFQLLPKYCISFLVLRLRAQKISNPIPDLGGFLLFAASLMDLGVP